MNVAGIDGEDRKVHAFGGSASADFVCIAVKKAEASPK